MLKTSPGYLIQMTDEVSSALDTLDRTIEETFRSNLGLSRSVISEARTNVRRAIFALARAKHDLRSGLS